MLVFSAFGKTEACATSRRMSRPDIGLATMPIAEPGTTGSSVADGRPFVAGDDYSIADMAIYPWIAAYDKLPPDFTAFPHLARWHASIAVRSATQRAYALKTQVNPGAGKPLSDEERKHLFGHGLAPK